MKTLLYGIAVVCWTGCAITSLFLSDIGEFILRVRLRPILIIIPHSRDHKPPTHPTERKGMKWPTRVQIVECSVIVAETLMTVNSTTLRIRTVASIVPRTGNVTMTHRR